MANTDFLNLLLPSQEDYFDIADFNGNWEAIDGQLSFDNNRLIILDEKVKGQANAIFNSASGEAIGITDSSERPLQALTVYGKSTQDGIPTPQAPVDIVSVKNPTIRLYGKNLLDQSAQTQTRNGITCTVNADKSITLRGSATATASFILNRNLPILPKGTNVTLKPNGDITGAYVQINYNKAGVDGRFVEITENTANQTKTAPIPDDFTAFTYFFVGVRQGATVNTTIRPQLEVGTVATEYEPYKTPQNFAITTSATGLNGVPVASGGNYTDQNGQQWIADELDYSRGINIQRIGVINSYNGETITTAYVSSTGELSQGAKVFYILETPIETTLSSAGMEAYKGLSLFYPSTTITSDKGAGLKVDYIADTKLYIDNKFNELSQALMEG